MTKSDKKAPKPHILVIDDDRRIRELVSRYLHEHGFVVMGAKDAADATEIMLSFEFDALVVDVMMPGQTGVEFTEGLREAGNEIPVLLLTALGEPEDRISGFKSGADDYLPKPFEPMELVLRLQSILRRTKKMEPLSSCFTIGKWSFNPKYDEIISGENIVSLTSVEGNLLRALIDSIGEVVSREELCMRCNMESGERTIDVQVTRLRRKIEESTRTPRHIQTVRGKGYLLRAERQA
ncbi:MAG: response regulator transcription factor [Alphaproteobacteria bacterium]